MATIADALLWNIVIATLLAGVIVMLSRTAACVRRPALRHALWLLVFAKLVTPPLIEIPILQSSQLPSASREGVGDFAALERESVNESTLEITSAPQQRQPKTTASETWVTLPNSKAGRHRHLSPPDGKHSRATSFLIAALLTSLAGSCVFAGLAIRRGWRMGRILKRAESGTTDLQREASRLAKLMGLANAPDIRVVEANVSPLLWASRKGPVVVLPKALLAQLSSEQVSAIVAHEIAHFARRDHWTSLCVFVVFVLFWWYPVAWYARRQVRLAQDECCDSLLLAQGTANRRMYAETLLEVLAFHSDRQPTLTTVAPGLGNGSSLIRRFEMLRIDGIKYRLSRPAVVVLVLFALFLPCIPTTKSRAEPAPPTGDAEEPIDQSPAKIPSQPEGEKAAEPVTPRFSANKEQRRRIELLIKEAPVTTGHPADLFELTPGRTSEYRLRAAVMSLPIVPTDQPASKSIPLGEVLNLEARKMFYIQWDDIGSSTPHYYGPFAGNPAEKLGLTLAVNEDHSKSATNQERRFGDPVELVVNQSLDLDNGRPADAKLWKESDEGFKNELLIKSGIDLFVSPLQSNRTQLCITNLIVMPLDADGWSIPVEQIVRKLRAAVSRNETIRTLSLIGPAPKIYAFQTAAGRHGVLEFVKPDEKTAGQARIRYKLIAERNSVSAAD